MKCRICGGSLDGSDSSDSLEKRGKHHDYGICMQCGEVLDDIIAAYFERLEKDVDLDSEIPYYVFMMSRKLKFLEQTMWWTAYDEMKKGNTDDEYFSRLERVVSWFESNPEMIRKIGEEMFAKCKSCGQPLVPGSVEVAGGDMAIVYCKKCGNEIVRCSMRYRLNY